MKIAFLGSRGIPACYSGFETFYEQLGTRLAARGHAVTVYNRAHFIRDVRGSHRGIRLVTLPSIPTKHLDTITHTLLATLHALTQRYDIVYYSIVGNSPLAWIPRVVGSRVPLNVDGEDWARAKWGAFARWYQRGCERVAIRTANVIIADARVIQRRYRDCYGAETIFVPYGANVARDERLDALAAHGLSPRAYYLYVGRLVPENAIDTLIEAYRTVRSTRKLVIVGDAPYVTAYKRRLRELAAADPRVVFTGYAFGDAYAQLSSHAYAYIQPSGVEGTRPALLDQMGFGNCVLVRDSEANREVVGESGLAFDRTRMPASLTEALQRVEDCPAEVETLRGRVRERIVGYYNWDWIAEFHEDLFGCLMRREPVRSYDAFLDARGRERASAV